MPACDSNFVGEGATVRAVKIVSAAAGERNRCLGSSGLERSKRDEFSTLKSPQRMADTTRFRLVKRK